MKNDKTQDFEYEYIASDCSYDSCLRDNIDKVKQMLYVKKLLITKNIKELKDEFSDDSSYKNFITSILELTMSDPCFCYLKDFEDKILSLINHNRFKLKTSGYFRELENDAVVRLNQGKTNASKMLCYYKENEEWLRRYHFDDLDILLDAVAYDSNVIDMFNCVDRKEQSSDDIDIDYFLSSTAFLLNQYPILYQINPNYINYTKQVLKAIKQQEKSLIQQVDFTEKKLELVKKKKNA